MENICEIILQAGYLWCPLCATVNSFALGSEKHVYIPSYFLTSILLANFWPAFCSLFFPLCPVRSAEHAKPEMTDELRLAVALHRKAFPALLPKIYFKPELPGDICSSTLHPVLCHRVLHPVLICSLHTLFFIFIDSGINNTQHSIISLVWLLSDQWLKISNSISSREVIKMIYTHNVNQPSDAQGNQIRLDKWVSEEHYTPSHRHGIHDLCQMHVR